MAAAGEQGAMSAAARPALPDEALRRPGLEREDLARVEQILGIESALDGAHQIDRVAQFLDQIVLLAEADAMFAGAGAVHAQGALDQSAVEALDLRFLLSRIGIDDEDDVEIAVADMA